jgi:hypothetical protein
MKNFSSFIKESLQDSFLTEGLIVSYPVSKLLNQIKKEFKDKIYYINDNLKNLPEKLNKIKSETIFTTNVEFKSDLTDAEMDRIDKICDVYGYTNSLKFVSKNRLQLEPKYPIKMNSFIESLDTNNIFHVTQKKYISKIKKIGLIPKLSQTTFDHSGTRIYLMWLPKKEHSSISNILNRWTVILSKNKKVNQEDMTILKIEYLKNRDYYLDDTTLLLAHGIFGLFTTSNIHPNDIEVLDI